MIAARGKQKEGVAFLLNNPRAYLLCEQGTGKTYMSLLAAKGLTDIKHALILAPKKVLPSWRKSLIEIEEPSVYEQGRKNALSAEENKWSLVNYDANMSAFEDIVYDLIIIDEATHYKNPGAARYKFAASKVKTARYVWALTGTPAPEGVLDLYGLIKLVTPDNLTRNMGGRIVKLNQRDYKQVVHRIVNGREAAGIPGKKYDYFSETWSVPVDDWKAKVDAVLRPWFRLEKEGLPDKNVIDLNCGPLPLDAMEYYNKLKRDGAIQDDPRLGNILLPNNGVKFIKLTQISSGILLNEDNAIKFKPWAKDRETIKLLDAARKRQRRSETPNNKTIVFTPYVESAHRLQGILRAYSPILITGTVNGTEELIESFKTTWDSEVIIAVPDSIAMGITLTEATQIIWYSFPFKSLIWMQGNDRIHRIGQTEPCYIYNLYSTKEDKELLSKLKGNEDSMRGYFATKTGYSY